VLREPQAEKVGEERSPEATLQLIGKLEWKALLSGGLQKMLWAAGGIGGVVTLVAVATGSLGALGSAVVTACATTALLIKVLRDVDSLRSRLAASLGPLIELATECLTQKTSERFTHTRLRYVVERELSLEGGVNVVRGMRLRVTSEEGLRRIPFRLFPNVGSWQTFEWGRLHLKEGPSNTEVRRVQQKVGGAMWMIELSPPVPQGQIIELEDHVSYTYERPLTKEYVELATLASEERARAVCGATVSVPTDWLEVRMRFPPGYEVRALEPRVLKLGQRMTDVEQELLRAGCLRLVADGDRPVAELVVSNPTTHYHYGFTYEPMSAKELEELRAELQGGQSDQKENGSKDSVD